MEQVSLKQQAGEKGAEFVEDGMVVGLGSGSTVAFTVKKIGQRLVEEELDIIGIPTSEETAALARSLNIPLSSLEEHPLVDVTIDGADEVSPSFDLIKGLGGALVREKMVAKVSKREVIVVDPSKMVELLGTRSPLPVEIVPFCWKHTMHLLEKMGCEPVPRKDKNDVQKLFVSDNKNYIIDCRFTSIEDPIRLEANINMLPGVVENGLFLDITTDVIVSKESGIEHLKK